MFVDNSLCASDCSNIACERHRSRQILGSPEMMARQSWADFSEECRSYIKIKQEEINDNSKTGYSTL